MSWLTKLISSNDGGDKPVQAHAGVENQMYYDKERKRWVERGKEHEADAAQSVAPPPLAFAKKAESSSGPVKSMYTDPLAEMGFVKNPTLSTPRPQFILPTSGPDMSLLESDAPIAGADPHVEAVIHPTEDSSTPILVDSVLPLTPQQAAAQLMTEQYDWFEEEPPKQPLQQQSQEPSYQPPHKPSQEPPYQPPHQQSQEPAYQPSYQPSQEPPYQPPHQQSQEPPYQPPHQQSQEPSYQPSQDPLYEPSYPPSQEPAYQPSQDPLYEPSYQPSQEPAYQPSREPAYQLLYQPSQGAIPQFVHEVEASPLEEAVRRFEAGEGAWDLAALAERLSFARERRVEISQLLPHLKKIVATSAESRVTAAAAGALWNLTFENMIQADAGNLPNLMVRCMNIHAGDASVAESATGVLTNLAVHSGNRADIIKAGAAEAVVAALRKHWGNTGLMSQACQLFCLLGATVEGRLKLTTELGIMDFGRELAMRPDQDMQKWGSWLVAVLNKN